MSRFQNKLRQSLYRPSSKPAVFTQDASKAIDDLDKAIDKAVVAIFGKRNSKSKGKNADKDTKDKDKGKKDGAKKDETKKDEAKKEEPKDKNKD